MNSAGANSAGAKPSCGQPGCIAHPLKPFLPGHRYVQYRVDGVTHTVESPFPKGPPSKWIQTYKYKLLKNPFDFSASVYAPQKLDEAVDVETHEITGAFRVEDGGQGDLIFQMEMVGGELEVAPWMPFEEIKNGYGEVIGASAYPPKVQNHPVLYPNSPIKHHPECGCAGCHQNVLTKKLIKQAVDMIKQNGTVPKWFYGKGFMEGIDEALKAAMAEIPNLLEKAQEKVQEKIQKRIVLHEKPASHYGYELQFRWRESTAPGDEFTWTIQWNNLWGYNGHLGYFLTEEDAMRKWESIPKTVGDENWVVRVSPVYFGTDAAEVIKNAIFSPDHTSWHIPGDGGTHGTVDSTNDTQAPPKPECDCFACQSNPSPVFQPLAPAWNWKDADLPQSMSPDQLKNLKAAFPEFADILKDWKVPETLLKAPTFKQPMTADQKPEDWIQWAKTAVPLSKAAAAP
jgi:hypothetical protein